MILTGDKVTDEALVKHHDAFAPLQHLVFAEAKITSAGFKEIAKFTALKHLEFNNMKVSPADLKELAALPALERLGFTATGMTDEGLKALAACTHLKEVRVEKEKETVSDAAKDELEKAVPGCKVTIVK